MIGDFRIGSPGDPNTVYVELMWHGDERYARLHISTELRQALALQDYPDADDAPMPVVSGLSYGIFLALATSFPLRVTGDLSVWDFQWGSLDPDPPYARTDIVLHKLI